MAAKTKRAQNKLVRDFIYKRSLETTKKKTFVNRINYEKLLPLKKRLFPMEFCKSKPRFKPTPYEKPVTRSQGQRSIGSNYANKENQSTSPSNQPKVIFTFNKSFDWTNEWFNIINCIINSCTIFWGENYVIDYDLCTAHNVE